MADKDSNKVIIEDVNEDVNSDSDNEVYTKPRFSTGIKTGPENYISVINSKEDLRDVMIPEIILRVKKMLETELTSLAEDIHELEQAYIQEENKNEVLTNHIIQLEFKNKELSDKLKSKSNSAIWENMQHQLQEKDKQIEQIKKELDFYKRNYNVKTFEGQTIFENTPVNKNDIKVEKVENKKKETKVEIKPEIKPEIKIETKPEVKQEIKSKKEIKQEIKSEVKQEVKEEKPKKKKAKKIEPVVDNTSLDDLEKELLK